MCGARTTPVSLRRSEERTEERGRGRGGRWATAGRAAGIRAPTVGFCQCHADADGAGRVSSEGEWASLSFDPPPPPVKVKKAAVSAPKLGAFGSDTDVPSTPKATSTVRGKKRKFNAFLAAGKHKPGAELRHMVHTRMVVREVCLPLTAFTNSRQFVRIIFDCLFGE